MTALNFKNISDVVDNYDVFLFDLWGVVVEGGYIYPGVVDNINKVISRKKVFFVTNAPRNSSYLLKMIQSWGINAVEGMLVSSGDVAVEAILNNQKKLGAKKSSLYHLGPQDNDIVNGIAGTITNDIETADILLLTLYRDEGPDLDLNEFDDILKIAAKRDILNICANPDIGIMQQGIYRYCAGYYAQKLKEFGGKVLYTGKPYQEIYDKVLNQLNNVPKNRILMIGDTFYTDILGANNIGIDSALVLTGNAEKFHIDYPEMEDKLVHLRIAAAEQNVMPSFVLNLG